MKELKQILKNIKHSAITQPVIAAASTLLLIPAQVKAQGQGMIGSFLSRCPQGTGVRCTESSLGSIVQLVIQWALGIAGITAVLVLIWGGFLYMFAAGNADQAKKGTTAIKNALIGLVVVVLSFVIVRIVFNFISGGSGGGLVGQ